MDTDVPESIPEWEMGTELPGIVPLLARPAVFWQFSPRSRRRRRSR